MLNVIDYVPGDTLLHHLNPVTKLALAAAIIIATFLSDTFATLLGLLAFTLLLAVEINIMCKAVKKGPEYETDEE